MSHHPIHKHMHTHITKSNVKAAIRDDKAHMTYLKEDVDKDQKYGGKYKDENQTADEKHISKLAGDVKHDEKKEHSSPAHHGSHRIPVIKDGSSHRHGGGGSTTVGKPRKEKKEGISRRESPKQEKKDLDNDNIVAEDATREQK